MGSHKLLVPRSFRFKPYTAHGLLFLRASPDLCERDPRHVGPTAQGDMAGQGRLRAPVLRQGRPGPRCGSAAAAIAVLLLHQVQPGPAPCGGAQVSPSGSMPRGAISSRVLCRQQPPASRYGLVWFELFFRVEGCRTQAK